MATTDSPAEAALVNDWADAWNARDADRLLELAHPEFRMHRVKGDVIDRDGVRDMVAKQSYGAAMKLFPQRLYGSGRRFAVAVRVEYRDVEQDELLGSTDDGGMSFEMRNGMTAPAAPQLTSADALARSGLTEEDLLVSWRVAGD
jgi:nuclear transport factor 2 (NTF2) superfamily protein